jgi:hypothetical protein
MAGVSDDEHAPILTATQARQGGRSYHNHMVWVLGVSMFVIVVGFVALWLSHAHGLSGSGGQTSVGRRALQQSGGFQAPPSQPRESENPQTAPTLARPADKPS